MKLTKKLAVSTVAASVALTAFAGIPLSSQGLAEKLGVSGVAYASSATADSTLEDDMEALYDALVETGGLPAVESLQGAFEALSIAAAGRIAAPVVDKFVTAGPEKEQLKALFFEAVSLYYSPSDEGLEKLRADHSAFIQSFAENADVVLSVDDIAEYFFDIQAEFFNQLGEKDLEELLTLMTNSSSLNMLLEDVLDALPMSEYAVEKVFLEYGVTTEDVIDVLSQVRIEIGNDILFINAATALFTAYESLNTDTPVGGGGGIVGGGAVTDQLPANVTSLLDNLKAALEKATDAEKAAIIEKFVKDSQSLINDMVVINAAGNVTVVNGQAELKLDDSKVLPVIAGIAAITAKVKEVAPKAVLKNLGLTFNLGAVTQKAFVLNLSDAVVKAGAGAKLTGSKFIVDKFEITTPFGGTFSSAISLTVKTSDATKANIGTLKSASSVFDFSLKVGGTETTKFSDPIVVSIPLDSLEGLDKELLSVAKIVNGKLEIHGGRVKGNSIIESRDAFSSYVVVENKVSFNDIASVQAWAGRQIEVIAAKGAIEGKAAGKFAPKNNVTRAEFAKMLVRGLDLENNSATESFDDVKAGDWHAPYVAAAVKLGIIKGRSASKFAPNATITRAEMATMITRALKVTTGAADVLDQKAALKGFADEGKISAALKDGVAFAANHQIVIGNAGKFLPNNNTTRAEAAVIIYRALNFDK
ncbi:S-layer homology domain-containing protein [Paenibacillus sp. Soil522]|uniref:S-layer homology domain-containing protein n=1 Tax=Paenibacillus sp. Soil522 TaxID=1736388 RepID=UPI0006F97303|nr:S-layer homology domain-containing protein [Paenibacillus sp. Soil522]KRE47879.1 hypothetical protein ASG81_08175 [Paenibacillus sp. Soil522]